jgi:hypothetical protein
MKQFFKKSAFDAFSERRCTVIGRKKVFTIDVSIVNGIVKEFFISPSSEDEADPVAAPHGDLSMNIFEPEFVIESNGSKTISCYRVTINNSLQFDYAASQFSVGLYVFRYLE